MKIKKYINDAQSSGIASKLLSYSAMAAAFVASGPEANAQCAGETSALGAPVGLDIDGDGNDDVQILGGSFSTILSAGSYTVPAGTIAVGTFPAAYAYAQASIPQSSFAGYPFYGCSLFNFGYGTFAGPPTLVVGPAVATATATASAMVSYTNAYYSVAYITFAAVNYCYATALGSNQIVGLSATGTGVCGVIDSAPGVAGVGTAAFVGSNYTVASSYAVALAGGVRYDFPTSTVTAMATASTTISGITCTTSTAIIYGGYYVAGPQLYLSTMATASVPPQPDATYTGPYLLAGPYYGSAVLATGGTNPVTALAVQFLGPDQDGDGAQDTYNGWVTFTCNGDGTITCTGSGYQQCSIENAILQVNSTAADACINVGEATNESPNCAPVCEISTVVSTMCDDAGTAEDPSDDVTTVMVTVNNSDAANFPTFTDDQGNAGVAYGTTLTYMVTGDGGLTVNFTDDTDGACTDSISVSTGCATVENIPTVGEWGLIMLGLLMSITAIVGIRQRREEEVTA